MFSMLKSLSSNTLWCQQRLIHTHSPMFCKDSNGKPPAIPIPLRRRTKLSPEDRMRDMLENVSDVKERTIVKNESNELSNPVPEDQASPVKKAPLPWKFGRRRSLSPLSRVQGMMEDQNKDTTEDRDKTDK